jgi:hypothetical protein
MGAGILPTTIYQNKLYFLFGKENKFADTPGWCDFGGGTEKGETFATTTLREGTEELTGFLGSEKDLSKLLKKHGTYPIMFNDNKYQMSIFPMKYDSMLPFYYNNNQRFLQKRLDPKVIEGTKIFEKAEIRWVCVDDLRKMRPQFRCYFKEVSDMIYNQKDEIYKFISPCLRENNNKQHRRTRKNRM